MKIPHIILPALGIIAGFAIGYSVHGMKSLPESHQPAPELTISPVEEPKEMESLPEKNREKELLLQAIQELDLTSADLEEAREYIRILERNTKRYNWLLSHWQEKGLGSAYQLNFDNENMVPSEELIDFFGWDDETVSEIKRLGSELSEHAEKWETENATIEKVSPTSWVFHIPPMPIDFIDAYASGMSAILDPDDQKLLSSKLEGNCNRLLSTRHVGMEVVHSPEVLMSPSRTPETEDYPHDADWLKIVEITESDLRPNNGFCLMTIPYPSEDTIPERWKHLYGE